MNDTPPASQASSPPHPHPRLAILVIAAVALLCLGLWHLMQGSPDPADLSVPIDATLLAATEARPPLEPVNWELVRDDSQWHFENWDELSRQMFLARAQDPQRLALRAHFDRNGDGAVAEADLPAYRQAQQAARYAREQRVADLIFAQFDADGDGVIAGAEMDALRAAWADYLAVPRNTARSSFEFVRVGRAIADEDGDGLLGIAEQRILSRLEEIWIWPPLNPATYDQIRHHPWDRLERAQLVMTTAPVAGDLGRSDTRPVAESPPVRALPGPLF